MKYTISCSGSRFSTNTDEGYKKLSRENAAKSAIEKILGCRPNEFVPDDGQWSWYGKYFWYGVALTPEQEMACKESGAEIQPD